MKINNRISWGVFAVLAIFFVSAFSLSTSVFADTDIWDGSISTNTNWTKNNSPYIVHTDIAVLPDVTFTIEPGVTVLFDDFWYIDVLGELIVEGTESERVILTTGPTNYYEWGGINVIDGGSYKLRYADISNTYYSLWGHDSVGSIGFTHFYNSWYAISIDESSLEIFDSSFDDIERYAIDASYYSAIYGDRLVLSNIDGNGIYIDGHSELELSDSNFDNVLIGITVDRNSSADLNYIKINNSLLPIQIYSQSVANVSNTEIADTYEGEDIGVYGGSLVMASSSILNTMGDTAIYFFDYTRDNFASILQIKDSVIDGGIDSGIKISGAESANIANTIIKNFWGTGLSASGVSPFLVHVINSEISNNDLGIVGYGARIKLEGSRIFNNSSFGVYNIPSSWDAASGLVLPPVEASGNWWGDASGPYSVLDNASGTANQVSENVEFAPWLLADPSISKPACCSNVLFIPGLQASRLYKKTFLTENQLWEPNRNADVEKLFLDTDGNSLDPDIYTRDIIKKTNIGLGIFDQNIYKSFADNMDNLVYTGKIKGWEALPYDWRFDLNKIVQEGVKMSDGSILNFVTEVIKNAEASLTGKVTIVTHSNGGLVAKILINELESQGKAHLIDRLIMVAAPQLGTPESIVGVLHGDGRELAGGFIVSKTTARTAGENMMGAYNLLPQAKYFSDVSAPVIKFDASVDKIDYPTNQMANFRGTYGDTIDSAVKLRNFLLGQDGRAEPDNSDINTPNVLPASLLNLAESNHGVIDNWTAPIGIKIVQLAGWGVSTLSGIEYFGRDTCVPGFQNCIHTVVLDRRPIFTEDGDKTVVSPSATAMGVEDVYYLNIKNLKQSTGVSIEHKDILEARPSLQFINNFVLDESIDVSEYITNNKPVSSDKSLELALHSPVSINIYDSVGNHTGLVDNPIPGSDFELVEEKVPNSRYMDFGEGKYVILPPSADYTVKLQGLDFGTFTLEIREMQGREEITKSVFVDILTSPTMSAELTINPDLASDSTLEIDSDGDSAVDFHIKTNTEFDPVIYLQMLRLTVNTFEADKKIKDRIIKKIDSIIKSIEKNKNKAVISKILSLSKKVSEKTKEREHNKKTKKSKNKLSKEDAESVLAMLDELLNNISK